MEILMLLNNNSNNNSDNTSKSETLGRLYTFLDNTNSNKSDYKFN
jgi:hypothetical protein